MIRHIVLFKFKEFESPEAKSAKLNDIKAKLDALPAFIPELKLLQIGINANPDEQYDLSLVSEFDSMADLHTYAVHPEHVAVGKIIRELLEARSCVDSEF